MKEIRKPCLFITAFMCMLSLATLLSAQSEPEEQAPENSRGQMNNERLQVLIQKIDPEFVGSPGYWQFKVEELEVVVVTDTKADRMRIIIPIINVTELSAEDLYRVLQANYDSALDARYAIAKGILWGTFIHPLSPLSDDEFLSGLGQTVNIVTSYGKSYSSGLFNFRGGDSEGIIQRKLLEELLEKGEVI